MTMLRLPDPHRFQQQFQQDHFVAVPKALPQSLVKQWRKKAQQITRYARQIQHNTDELQLVYEVVTGETIKERWPGLFAFYQNPGMLDWIRRITSERAIYTSSHLQSAANLNIMSSVRSVYRWHFDAVAYTVLIYLTDVAPGNGGALELVPRCQPQKAPPDAEHRRIQLWPKAGTLVLMDGTRCYHRVARLRHPITRLSIPLVYPNSQHATRDAALDSYLYEPPASKR